MPKLPSIPGYVIDRCIGRGGMGSVFRAEQISLGRRVALKVMHASLVEQDEKFAERFKREAVTTASLRHPNIIAVHDSGEYDGHCYLAMDFIEGGSLRDLLDQGPLTIRRAFRICAGIASGLAAAHAAGFVHRDIKPENILLDGTGAPVITDFGIVKVTYSQTELTGTSTVGSPSYMSPEQLMGMAELDGRADLYSLGVVLFEMLEGRKPFESDAPFGVGMMHLNDEPPPLAPRNEPFQSMVSRLLMKNPDKRFQSGGEVIDALRSLREELTQGSRRITTETPTVNGPASTGENTVARSRRQPESTVVRSRGSTVSREQTPRAPSPAPVQLRSPMEVPVMPRRVAPVSSLHSGRSKRLLDDVPVADPNPTPGRGALVQAFLASRLVRTVVGVSLLWIVITLLVPGLSLATMNLEIRGLVGSPAEKREVARRFDLLGNMQRMRYWLGAAARGGLPGASYELGMSHYRGGDETEAIPAFQDELRSADSYNELAELMLAETLCNGRDLENCRRAETLLKRTVDAHGNRRAMHKLGEIHLTRVSPPDYAEAALWYQRTIDAEGQPIPRSSEATDAMVQLAALYEEGRGVQRDQRQSARLLALAARSPVAKAPDVARARTACDELRSPPEECGALEER